MPATQHLAFVPSQRPNDHLAFVHRKRTGRQQVAAAMKVDLSPIYTAAACTQPRHWPGWRTLRLVHNRPDQPRPNPKMHEEPWQPDDRPTAPETHTTPLPDCSSSKTTGVSRLLYPRVPAPAKQAQEHMKIAAKVPGRQATQLAPPQAAKARTHMAYTCTWERIGSVVHL